MTIPKYKKRQLLNYGGVNVPALPSIEEVNKTLSSTVIETLEHDPLTEPNEYDKEAAQILEEGKIYIGMYSKEIQYFIYLSCIHFLGKETSHHLTTNAKRRVNGQDSSTVILSKKEVPTRELDLRFILVKLAKSIVDWYGSK